LISDEGAERGGTRPDTNGIPVYSIAIGTVNRCKEDLAAIAKHTRGKAKYFERQTVLDMR